MPANTAPIFPITPVVGVATLTAAAAVTSRANITGTTGLVQLIATSTNGTRVDVITVKGKGTTVATTVGVWVYNGTTSFLFDEIDLAATTPTTTIDSVSISRSYSNLVLPPTHQLFISEQVSTDINVFAFGGAY
jgi:hypothetical protein